MKIVEKIAAQGSMIIRRIDSLPPDAEEQPSDDEVIVEHSETGHHHVIERGARLYQDKANPLIAYLEVQMEFADLVHKRHHDTHETLRLPRGIWQISRQREATPEGWRQVQD